MKPCGLPALPRAVRARCVPFLLVWLVALLLAAPPVGAQQRERFSMFCSPSASDLADALARAHAAAGNSTTIHCRPADSSNVMARLQGGECDVGLVIGSLAARSPHALHESFPTFPLAQYVVGVVVNSSNPVRSLRAEQLGAAFSGKSRSWSELDRAGGARAIELYSPVLQLTQSYIFQHNTMRNQWFAIELRDRNANPQRQKRFPDAIVGAVIENAGAIGFFQLPPDMILDKRVRLLHVAADEHAPAVPPSLDSVAHGTYPIIDRLTLYVHPHAPAAAHEFVEFATGPEGAKIIRQFGLWSEYELEKPRTAQRVADAKAGKGAPVAVCDLAGVGKGLKEASWEFARAKMAVQVALDTTGGSVERAVERLETGAAELLVMDGRLGEAMRGRVVEMGGAEAVLGSRAVGVVVHAQNPFNELAKDDVRQILSGEIDRWPGLSGTDERIVLYGLPAASPLMQMVDDVLWPRGIGFQPVSSEAKREADRGIGFQPVISGDKPKPDATPDKLEAYPTKRAAMTRRPDTGRVILSVAAQPGAMGLVDLSEFPRHETKVKLLAILPPGERQAIPPGPGENGTGPIYRNGPEGAAHKSDLSRFPQTLPPGYPLAQPVHLYLSGKASDAAKAFFAFVAEGNACEGLLAHGVVPRAAARERTPHTEAMAVMPADFRDVVLGDFEEEAEEAAEGALPVELPDGDPFQLPDAEGDGTAAASGGRKPSVSVEGADGSPDAPARPETAAAAGSETGGLRPPLAESDGAQSADAFDAWARANAVPIVLVSLAALSLAVALATATTRRNRRRNVLLRRYRSGSE